MKKLITLILVFILVLAGCSKSNATSHPEFTDDTRKYTLEKYLQIKLDSTYQDVISLLGDPGENIVDNDRLKQYTWENVDKSNISVTFYDQKVTGKSQAYLGPLLTGKKAVTLDKFNKIKVDMTLQETINILGPGTERVLTKIEGKEKIILGWDNMDGSSIGVTLVDGKVTEKYKIMLD